MNFYRFGPGITECSTDKNVVGGKGASLGIMSNMGINVPPGFIIPIPFCTEYWSKPPSQWDAFMKQITPRALEYIEDMPHPTLFSVRSGAPVSMPGMMDTILNVGLTSKTIPTWETLIGVRAAWDSYRRLILMLSTTGFGLSEKLMNAPLDHVKEAKKVSDTELAVEDLQDICIAMAATFEKEVGSEFPDTLEEQLNVAIEAVFSSWNSDRAKVYRKINKLEHVTGTAVTIQSMVFGNMNDNSGTGVLFTRDPLTGDKAMYGEFLANAQGEDVVAGIRTPQPVAEMLDMDQKQYDRELWQCIHGELEEVCEKLEALYNDMVDIEFTVQNGELFILQSRVGKRSAKAAIKIALDMYEAGLIEKEEVFKRVTKPQYKFSKRPSVDPAYKQEPFVTGINASPGVATGLAVMSAEEAVKAKAAGTDVILVVEETTPEDIAGMDAAVGILTRTGGSTSHAAVVARAMDKPCVCGATDLVDHIIVPGDMVTICGSTGRVWINKEVPVIGGADTSRQFLIDLAAGENYQLINLLEIDDDGESLPKNVAINLSHNLMAGAPVEDIGLAIAGIQVLGHNVLLDLSMEALEATRPLRTIFGPDPLSPAYVKVCNELLSLASKETLDPSKMIVTRGSDQVMAVFKKAGFKQRKTASTVADLMSGDAVEVPPDFITNVVGSEEAYVELKSILEAAGKKISAGASDIHAEAHLFTRLAD